MGCRSKVWNKRNQQSAGRSSNLDVDLSKWEEEAAQQRDLNRFYRELKMRSLRERIRKFVVRRFLNRQKRKEVKNNAKDMVDS